VPFRFQLIDSGLHFARYPRHGATAPDDMTGKDASGIAPDLGGIVAATIRYIMALVPGIHCRGNNNSRESRRGF